MTESLPWVMYLFYITAGYMLVIGITASAVAVVARSTQYRTLYGVLAIAGLAGAAYQTATAYYYLAPAETEAIQALVWQMDFATVSLLSIFLFMGLEVRKGRLHGAVLFGVGLVAIMLIVANRVSSFSLHFDEIELLVQYKLGWNEGLRTLRGLPGVGTWIWYDVAAIAVLGSFYWVYLSWHQISRLQAYVGASYLVLQILCLVGSAFTDLGLWDGSYLIGFAFFEFILCISVGMAIESALKSRKLKAREREMEGEIRQRRRAEDKLERLSQVFMQAPTASHIIDLSGKTIQVNEESIRFLRRDVSAPPKVNFLSVLELLGVDKKALLNDLAAGKVKEYGPYFFAAGLAVDSLYVVKDAWLSIKLHPIFNKAKTLQECVVRLEDVTEKQFVENAIKTISMATSAEMGQAFFTHLVVHLARLLSKKYVYIGLKKSEGVVDQIETLAMAIDGELVENLSFPLRGATSEKVLERGVFAVPKRAAQEFPKEPLLQESNLQSFLGVAITNENKEAIGVIAVLDVKPMEQIEQVQEIVNIFVSRAASELHRLDTEKQIRTMAYEDYLTGLPNRTELNEYVGELLEFTESGMASGFLQVDLDHFKMINDALGHDVGDEVLRFVGRRLHQNMDAGMVVARIGGDEFAVVVEDLGDYPREQLDFIVHKLIALMEQPVHVGDHLLDVGCTVGAVIFPEFAETSVDVFRHADIALNKAKTIGRGGYQLFTPEMRNSVSKRLSIEKGLRKALQNNEFHLFYQPQVDASGCMTGAEALIRWQDPKKGWISPSEFIPVAEESGLINPIGQWIIELALERRKYWSEAQIPFVGHLSVNVSSWQFARSDFVETVIISIEKTQIPPSHITLEVTETALLSDINDTIGKLAELRRFGITIALDDFGTGYSSLAYLRDLPLDILKIDKTFVDALETNAHEPLVESMISIGRHMGLQVVAEGVETPIQLERLKALGCSIFQGYLFSKPLSEEHFVEWLNNRDSYQKN